MKAIKSITLVVLLASFSQMNAQKILEKWEELNNVNQIVTKVDYVANDGNFEILGQYTTILKEHTGKLDKKSIPAELVTPEVTKAIDKLNTEATTLNDAVQKKAPKAEILSRLKNFNETLQTLIRSFKLE
jgi:hypothetical protein